MTYYQYTCNIDMSRLVIKTAHGPHVISSSQKEIHICMCGLSKNQPFCDGSHKKTLDEAKDTLYKYEDDGSRVEVEMEHEEEGCCGGGCCGGKCEEEHKS